MKAYITIEVEIPDSRSIAEKQEQVSEVLDEAKIQHRISKVVTVRGDMRDEPLPQRVH